MLARAGRHAFAMARAVPPNWIESIRLRLLMSHHELAARVCCSRQTIRSIERGTSIPSVALALAIARELDTTVEELFGCADLR